MSSKYQIAINMIINRINNLIEKYKHILPENYLTLLLKMRDYALKIKNCNTINKNIIVSLERALSDIIKRINAYLLSKTLGKDEKDLKSNEKIKSEVKSLRKRALYNINLIQKNLEGVDEGALMLLFGETLKLLYIMAKRLSLVNVNKKINSDDIININCKSSFIVNITKKIKKQILNISKNKNTINLLYKLLLLLTNARLSILKYVYATNCKNNYFNLYLKLLRNEGKVSSYINKIANGDKIEKDKIVNLVNKTLNICAKLPNINIIVHGSPIEFINIIIDYELPKTPKIFVKSKTNIKELTSADYGCKIVDKLSKNLISRQTNAQQSTQQVNISVNFPYNIVKTQNGKFLLFILPFWYFKNYFRFMSLLNQKLISRNIQPFPTDNQPQRGIYEFDGNKENVLYIYPPNIYVNSNLFYISDLPIVFVGYNVLIENFIKGKLCIGACVYKNSDSKYYINIACDKDIYVLFDSIDYLFSNSIYLTKCLQLYKYIVAAIIPLVNISLTEFYITKSKYVESNSVKFNFDYFLIYGPPYRAFFDTLFPTLINDIKE